MRVKCTRCGHLQDIAPRRSRQASAFFHVACARYSIEMGMRAEDSKIMFKQAYGVWEPVPFRGAIPEWPGQFVRLYAGQQNEQVVFMKSESAYTKAEERQLTEGVRAEAFDAGIDMSDVFDE